MILAAGGGARFAGPTHKLLAPYRGRPLVLWAIAHALESGIGPVAVVCGAIDLRPLLPRQVTVVRNPAWVAGQASSLQAAIGWATRRRFEAVVLALGDQPEVPAAAWQAIAAAPGPIATATFHGRRSPPVLLERVAWAHLPLTGDVGARVVMAEHPEWVTDVPCAGEPDDVDTEDDLLDLAHRHEDQPWHAEEDLQYLAHRGEDGLPIPDDRLHLEHGEDPRATPG